MSEPTSRDFYDRFAKKLLTDYASANSRTERAIAFAVESLPADASAVLDIGCGIGWSASEYVRHHPTTRVHAIDLSARLVATATSLFGSQERLQFMTHDFIEESLTGRFDAITLLDVYEHFPLATRPVVHKRLGELLHDAGRVILTFPTPEHQRYLREASPAGLQPVDEDVTSEDLRALASDLRGRVVLDRKVSIWRPDDYGQAIIERGSARSVTVTPRLEPIPQRQARLQRMIGARWTRAAGLVAARPGPNICVAAYVLGRVSETFIRAHIERLGGRVHVIHGDPPLRTEEGQSLLTRVLGSAPQLVAERLGIDTARAEDRLARRLPAVARARLLARHLAHHRTDVVLAEYGPMAAELHAACRLAGVALVPHFHGYDAFEHDVVQAYGDRYRAIFADGAPVVAVSESMGRHLISLGADPTQVFVNCCGVDMGEFPPAEPVPDQVVAIGRLVDKKAPELTLLAFARAREQVPDARLVMVGDGPLRAAAERLVGALGLQHHVRLTGALNHAGVADVLHTASLFVQHSVVAANGDREGTPVAVLEAGAVGVPVVATRHEGILDVVVDGETGLLVDEGDIDGMATAIVSLLRDQDRARRLGEAARARIAAEYAIEDSIARLSAILEQAAGAARARRYPERADA